MDDTKARKLLVLIEEYVMEYGDVTSLQDLAEDLAGSIEPINEEDQSEIAAIYANIEEMLG